MPTVDSVSFFQTKENYVSLNDRCRIKTQNDFENEICRSLFIFILTSRPVNCNELNECCNCNVSAEYWLMNNSTGLVWLGGVCIIWFSFLYDPPTNYHLPGITDKGYSESQQFGGWCLPYSGGLYSQVSQAVAQTLLISLRFELTGDTRKIFVSNIRPSTSLTRTVDESHSARVLIGCKPIKIWGVSTLLSWVCPTTKHFA